MNEKGRIFFLADLFFILFLFKLSKYENEEEKE